jgi:hypothetical protein
VARIFIVADTASRAALRGWLRSEVVELPNEQCPSAYVALPGAEPNSMAEDDAPTVLLERVAATIQEDDIVVVAGPQSEFAIGELLRAGVRNLFDGNEILRSRAADRRFLRLAQNCYVGPTEPVGQGLPVSEAARFDIQPVVADSVPCHKLFIVNSMPKSGTLWMVAMLEAMLGVRAREQITISHVGDLEVDWNKPNNHAAVTLVRDLRAVIVSWFHHLQRTDRELGFRRPRYATIEAFYWEHFLGTVRATRRFYGGNLEHWLDVVAANFVPIVRFEDLVSDTSACLLRVVDAWRIELPDARLSQVVRDFTFDRMTDSLRGANGYVADMVARGHLRRGKSIAWREELPHKISTDVQSRFKGYQTRLGYGDDT